MWLFLAGLAVGLCAAAYAYYRYRVPVSYTHLTLPTTERV